MASASSSGEGGGKSGSSSSGKIWPEACIGQNPSIFLQSGPEFFLLSINEFDHRILKSHAPPHLLITGRGSPSHLSGSGCSSGGDESKEEFALPEGVKVIIVTRNPLDPCVSSYYHAWNPCKSGWPFSAWAAAWLSGNVPHGSWFEWVKAWRRQAQANPAQILWLQFEDIKSDPFAIIREIAQFLSLSLQLCGPESSTGTDSDNVDILAAVVRASSFDAMKEQAHSNSDIGVVQRHLRKGLHTACPCSLCDSPDL